VDRRILTLSRKPKPYNIKKGRITIILPNWVISRIRKVGGYNKIIEDILLKNFPFDKDSD